MDETPIGERLDIREVGHDNWNDFVRLFEGRGSPSYCYCLVWREPSEARKSLDLAGRRALTQQQVAGVTPLGLLAYLDGVPVG